MSEQNKACVSYTLFTALSKASCSLTYYLACFAKHTNDHDLELSYSFLCLFFNVCFINFPRAGILFMLSTDTLLVMMSMALRGCCFPSRVYIGAFCHEHKLRKVRQPGCLSSVEILGLWGQWSMTRQSWAYQLPMQVTLWWQWAHRQMSKFTSVLKVSKAAHIYLGIRMFVHIHRIINSSWIYFILLCQIFFLFVLCMHLCSM